MHENQHNSNPGHQVLCTLSHHNFPLLSHHCTAAEHDAEQVVAKDGVTLTLAENMKALTINGVSCKSLISYTNV